MKKYSVLVVGGGGRESALIHAYAKSPQVAKLYAVPGNDLMQDLTTKPVKTFPSLKTTDKSQIVNLCKSKNVTLVDIAQDNAVESGLGDALLREGILHVGPTRAAGQIEWDKGWSREFMKTQSIPHPSFNVCRSEKEGCDYLEKYPDQPWVIKANGLVEGKGVILTENIAQAKKAMQEMKRFGLAGQTFLLEQMLCGEEFSTFAISDGKSYQIVGSAQDHKRVNDHDEGPNTGGMGCSARPMLLTSDIMNQVTNIIDRTLKGMEKIGRPYKGILYLGGMLVKKGSFNKPYVIEYNARWGDPEAQVMVPSISNDFFDVGIAITKGEISKLKIKTDKKAHVAVAGVSYGYPVDYSRVRGKEIFGIEKAQKVEGVILYGAGIKRVGGKNYVNGGRLFYIVGEGSTIIKAREKAYQAMSLISIDGNNLHYRTDIGWRDVQRLAGCFD